MRRIVYQVNSFTRVPLTGNPAGVVLDADGLSDGEMQAIARELNNSETAFVSKPTGSDHDVRVRFFTPTVEVPSCGHATIAAHYVRARVLGLSASSLVQKTGAGMLPIEITARDGDIDIIMTQAEPVFEPVLASEVEERILAALGVGADERADGCPMQVVSTGHSKVMVGVASPAAVDALEPDLGRLAELSAEIGCNGYFAFAVTPPPADQFVYGRMFAPAIGIAEDPVTGNAHGPVGAYLVHHQLVSPGDGVWQFSGVQGVRIGRPGTVNVLVDICDRQPARVRVAGSACIVFEAELCW